MIFVRPTLQKQSEWRRSTYLIMTRKKSRSGIFLFNYDVHQGTTGTVS